MQNQKFNLVIFTFILVFAVSSIGLSVNAQNEDEVMVVVNETEITRAEFYNELEEHAGTAILNQMIMDELLQQKQDELGVQITDEDINTGIYQIAERLGGIERLQQSLMQAGLDEQQFREQVRLEVLITKLAGAEVKVTEDEVVAWFEKNKNNYGEPEQVEASHILVETEAEANDLIAKLENDSDFAELAAEYSTDTGSAELGGALGFFSRGDMIEPFENAAFSVEPGEITTAQSQFGWHVIKVTDKIIPEAPELDEVYDVVKSDVRANKAPEPGEYLDSLWEESNIEFFSEKYKQVLDSQQ